MILAGGSNGFDSRDISFFLIMAPATAVAAVRSNERREEGGRGGRIFSGIEEGRRKQIIDESDDESNDRSDESNRGGER